MVETETDTCLPVRVSLPALCSRVILVPVLAGQRKTQKNPPADRRFIQSAGPFTLQPGAVNEVVTGAVWARGFYLDEIGSVCELFRADKIAQALFDSDFTLLDGPDAPEVVITEMDREIIINWGYSEASRTVRNNYNESYLQADPVLKAEGVEDSVFRFEGYIVYQMIDQTVGPDELNDPDRARIVFQCDVANDVTTIVNRTESAVEGLDEPVIMDEVMVQGNNEGIFNSVRVSEDLFAQADDKNLRNYTTYHYAVIAYAYNDTASDGRQFVQGNRFFQVRPAMPHPVEFTEKGTVLNSEYGDGIPVTQVGGVGNGGNFVMISPESEAEILEAPYKTDAITYTSGAAPINVKVTDPKDVKGGYYQVRVTNRKFVLEEEVGEDDCGTAIDSTFAEWELYEGSNPDGPFDDLIYQATYVERSGGCLNIPARPEPLVGTERVIIGHGISVSVRDVEAAGDTADIEGNTGVIGGSLTFADEGQPWLAGLTTNEAFFGGIWYWIQGGPDGRAFKNDRIYDRNGDFMNIVTGWGPMCLAREFNNNSQAGGQIAPGLPIGCPTTNRQMCSEDFIALDELPDVDIVFTADITKWSKCMVIETSPNSSLGTGAWLQSGKWSDNIEDPNELTKPVDERTTVPKQTNYHGFSWFPGYAIDVNTGERLNIFFGESEWDIQNRGNDMTFNPTEDFGNDLSRVGGRHYVWVSNTRYDEFESLKDTLTNANTLPAGAGDFSDAIGGFPTGHNLADVYKYVSWVGIPLLNSAFANLTDPTLYPTDARVSLRVKSAFPFSRRNQ